MRYKIIVLIDDTASELKPEDLRWLDRFVPPQLPMRTPTKQDWEKVIDAIKKDKIKKK